MAENILTRKYGGVPGWAIAGGAVVVGVGFFYFRSKGTSTSSTNATNGSLTNNPAASSIPYVPSVTVTGIPSSNPTPGSGVTTPSNTVTTGSNAPTLAGFGGQIPVYTHQRSGDGDFTQVTTIPTGQTLTVTGSPVSGNWKGSPATWLPVSLYGTQNSYFVSVTDVTPSSGSGGWGQAGSVNPIGMFGWTSGWSPLGGGNPGAVLSQRAGLQTVGSGGRFDYGGAGGSGASNSANRNKTSNVTRRALLKRRKLSGRR